MSFLDMGMDQKEYYDYIYNLVTSSKKKDFDETMLLVCWFKKITQLSLLDNNEIYER